MDPKIVQDSISKPVRASPRPRPSWGRHAAPPDQQLKEAPPLNAASRARAEALTSPQYSEMNSFFCTDSLMKVPQPATSDGASNKCWSQGEKKTVMVGKPAAPRSHPLHRAGQKAAGKGSPPPGTAPRDRVRAVPGNGGAVLAATLKVPTSQGQGANGSQCPSGIPQFRVTQGSLPTHMS